MATNIATNELNRICSAQFLCFFVNNFFYRNAPLEFLYAFFQKLSEFFGIHSYNFSWNAEFSSSISSEILPDILKRQSLSRIPKGIFLASDSVIFAELLQELLWEFSLGFLLTFLK